MGVRAGEPGQHFAIHDVFGNRIRVLVDCQVVLPHEIVVVHVSAVAVSQDEIHDRIGKGKRRTSYYDMESHRHAYQTLSGQGADVGASSELCKELVYASAIIKSCVYHRRT